MLFGTQRLVFLLLLLPALTAISLSGSAPVGFLSVTPGSLSFGNVTVGTTNALPLILQNTGSASLTISAATVTGSGFSISGLSLPLTLAVATSTAFSVDCGPTATGSVTGSVSLVSNASNSPTVVALACTGAVMLAWNKSSGAVGYNVYRGSSSGGPYPVKVCALVTTLYCYDSTGQPGLDYYVATAVNSAGVESSYSNQAPPPPGTLGFVSATPTSLNFGNVTVGTTPALPVILQNTGSATLTISVATVTGSGLAISGLALPLTLAVEQSTSFSVDFAPTVTGSVTGSLFLIGNASDSPTVVALAGRGVATLTWTASTSTGVVGYNVYRGPNSGGPYPMKVCALVTALYCYDRTVGAGEHYYVVTAVNSAGVESAYSNQAQVVIP